MDTRRGFNAESSNIDALAFHLASAPHSKRDLNQALGVLYMCFIFTKWPNLRVLFFKTLLALSCFWIRIMQLLLQGVDVCLSLAEIYQCRLITYEPIKAPPIIGTVVPVSLIEPDSRYTI